MAQFTKSDLAIRVLQDLNVIASDETPTAADKAFVEETIESEFSMMEADGIQFWSTTDDSIYPTYFTQLSRRIALSVGPHFGKFTVAEAEQAIPMVEDRMRRIGAGVKNPELLQIDAGAATRRQGDEFADF